MDRDDYTRAVTPVRVIDGDTVIVDVDLGFYVRVRMSCRLVGINAPEHDEPGGPESRAELTRLLGLGPVTVTSVRADKFAGRFDAHVTVTLPSMRLHKPGVVEVVESSIDVNAWLVAHGLAVDWDGTGPKPHVPWPPNQTP